MEDIDGLRVRASPEALRCVFEHDTKYPVLSTGFPPMKSEGYCFDVGRLCTRLSVCLSTCPSRNIPKYLLVRFGAFSA